MTITHTAAPASEPTTYSIDHDPTNGVRVWDLTDHERVIYELGFVMGYGARQPEVDQLDHEAGRLYVAAFDHRHCNCWRQHQHNVTWLNPPSTAAAGSR